jgi:hypothetical protein
MGFEPMIRVLQTLALATWPRRRHSTNRGLLTENPSINLQSSIIRAGDGIRTHDLLLGKETFYH